MHDGAGYMDRIWRASQRAIVPVGPLHYAVAGNEQPVYYVNLEIDTPCDCKFAQFNPGKQCIHELAARIAHLESPYVDDLQQQLAARQLV